MGNRSFCAAAAFAAAMGLSFDAQAQNKVTAIVSQGFTADTNIDLSPNSPGDVYIFTPGVDLEFSGGNDRFEGYFGAGAGLSLATGAGETSDLDGLNPRLRTGFARRSSTMEIRGDAFLKMRPVSVAGDEIITDPTVTPTDPGVIEPPSGGGDPSLDVTSARARQLDFGAGFGLDWKLDQVSTANAKIFASARRFYDASGASANELVESERYGARIGYSEQLTPLTEVGFGLTGIIFDPNSGRTKVTRSIALTGEIGMKLTPRHDATLMGGISLVDTERSALGGGGGDTSVGFIGSAEFSYTLSDFEASVLVEHSIEPSSLGELQNQTDFFLNLSHAVNSRLRVGFVGGATYETGFANGAAGTDRFLATVGPSLQYSLTRDASLSVGYRFRYSDQEARDSATSNAVFLTVSHTFEGLF